MIKVSIVILAGLAGATILRRRSAAVRHFVLAFAMTCAAATPLLQRIVPERPLTVGTAWTQRLDLEPTSPSPTIPIVDTATQSEAPSRSSTENLPSYATIWLAGVLAGLGTLLLGLGRLASLAAGSRPVVDGPWMKMLATLGADCPVARRVRLLESDRSPLVVTWGFLRPRIMVPRSTLAWPTDRIAVVLNHELAHIRRYDWAVQLMADVFRAAYWFNPLLWLACHRLRQESERACDDAVLATGVAAPDYAVHLLDVARAFRRNGVRWFPAPAAARQSQLERRVRAMLNGDLDRRPVTPWAGAAIAAVLFGLSVCVAGLVAASNVAVPPLSTLVTPQPSPSLGPANAERELPPHAAAIPQTKPPRAPLTADGTGAVQFVDSQAPPEERHSQAPSVQVPGQKSAVSGTLLDGTGRFIPAIPVALIDAEGRRYETESDSAGRYSVAGLEIGEYQVEVKKPGFLSRQGRIIVGAGQQLERDIVAQIGSLQETVVVSPASGPAMSHARPSVPTPAFDPCADSPVGGCLTPPRKLAGAPPSYPPASMASGMSGKVQVEGRIGTDGFVKELRVADGADAALAASALAAVGQWQFSPVRLNGIAQECPVTVVVLFQLVDRD